MLTKPSTCAGCSLETLGRGYVPAVAPAGATILAVAEAPGATEASLGRPLVGRSGVFLDKLCKMAGIDRSTWAVHNVISCQPPGNVLRGAPYRDRAIYQCGPNLEAVIDQVTPKIIVAFGDTALERLTGNTGIQRYRGFWMIGPRGIPTISTFHPAYLLPGRTEGELRKDRPSRFIGAVLWDLMRAAEAAALPGGWRRLTTRYLVNPEPSVFADFVTAYENQLANRGPELMLTYDIETPGKAPKGQQQVPMLSQPIIRISFAFESGWSVSVPFDIRYMALILRLLRSTGITTGWNSWSFDNPVLRQQLSEDFLRGPHYDMMRAWHVLQSDLPKDLEFVASFFTDLFPWKHLNRNEPGLYSAIDSDAQIRISYGVRGALQPKNQWDVYLRLVAEIQPFLATAGRRGLPIDVEAQQALQTELETDLKREFIASQADVPARFYQRKIYVRKPERTHAEIPVNRDQKICSCGFENPTIVHYRGTKKKPPCTGAPGTRSVPTIGYLAIADLNPENPLASITDEIGECGFNPLAVPQVTAYAAEYRHLDLLRSSGTKVDGLDDTVLGALIKRFGKDHPIYARVQTIREKNKKLGTYVLGYKPDADGRIYTRYNDNPSTLRLGSQDVNTQNIPDDIKKTIRAPRGWTFVEVDSAAIEAVMVGLAARDAQYVVLASKGVHDFVNCKANGIAFDALGIERSKNEFAATRKVKKMTVHLSNFGGTPRTMRRQAPEVYLTEKQAFDEQQFYFEVCPRIREWHTEVRMMTARTHVLINPWNFHQYFYEVFDGSGPGEDFNRCLGAGPQSMAAMFMRENLGLLSRSEWAQFAGANVSTHDSLGLLVPTFMKTEARKFLLRIMTRPVPQLDNVRIGAEAKESADGGVLASVKLHPEGMRVVETIRFDDPLELSTWHR